MIIPMVMHKIRTLTENKNLILSDLNYKLNLTFKNKAKQNKMKQKNKNKQAKAKEQTIERRVNIKDVQEMHVKVSHDFVIKDSCFKNISPRLLFKF